jgi:hypothetical protein
MSDNKIEKVPKLYSNDLGREVLKGTLLGF